MVMPTLRTVCCTSLLVLTGLAQAVTLAPGPGGANSTAKAVRTAPTQSSAPLVGLVTSIDVKKSEIGINNQRFVISPGLVSLLDKRPGTDGLLSLDKVAAGMYVRYRTEKSGEMTRVVELWILRNPETSKQK